MPIIEHATLPAQPSTRSGIPIRRLVSRATGATQSEVWEQIMQPGDQIPRHYHELEETVVFLSGTIAVTIGEEVRTVAAPVTVLIPATILHQFRNVGTTAAQMLVFFPGLDAAVIYPDGERRYADTSQRAESSHMDSQTTLADLRSAIHRFVEARAWYRYHTPKNLAMSIAIEAAELMEHFQWSSLEESTALLEDEAARAAVADELADVLIYCLSFANSSNIDVSTAIQAKLARNEVRFPVDQVRGRR